MTDLKPLARQIIHFDYDEVDLRIARYLNDAPPWRHFMNDYAAAYQYTRPPHFVPRETQETTVTKRKYTPGQVAAALGIAHTSATTITVGEDGYVYVETKKEVIR